MKDIAKQLTLMISKGRELYRIKLYRFMPTIPDEMLLDIKTNDIEDYWHGFVIDGVEYDMNIWDDEGKTVASIYETNIDSQGFTDTLTDKFERIEVVFN